MAEAAFGKSFVFEDSSRVDGVEPAPRGIQTHVARRSETVDDEVRSPVPDARGGRVEPKRPAARLGCGLVREPDELGRREGGGWARLKLRVQAAPPQRIRRTQRRDSTEKMSLIEDTQLDAAVHRSRWAEKGERIGANCVLLIEEILDRDVDSQFGRHRHPHG